MIKELEIINDLNKINSKTEEKLLNKLIDLHYFELQEFVIAPNDKEVLLVFGNTDMPHDEYAYEERNRSIWKFNLTSGELHQLTAPKDDANTPCWSPNAQTIAYLSRESGKKGLWFMDRNGENKQQVETPNFPGKDLFTNTTIKWSPDGRSIAFTAHPNGSFYGLWQSIAKEHEESSNIQIENGNNKQEAFRKKARSLFQTSLFVYDIDANEINVLINQCVKPIRIHDWYHDQNHLLIHKGPKVIQINIDTLHEEVLYQGSLDLIKLTDSNIFTVRFDGEQLSAGYLYNNQVVKKHVLDLSTYEMVTIHNGSKDLNQIFFTAQQGVSNILYCANLETGKVQQVTEQGKTVEDIPTCPAKIQSFHKKDAIIFPYSQPQEMTELFELESSGQIKKMSDFSLELVPKNTPKVSVVHYLSNGFKIESLLVLPNDYDVKKTYPALVYLHGGPEDYIRANLSELISARAESAAFFLAAHGYVILMPNFRGSAGYGESFESELANYQLLQTPYEDVIAGVDYLIQEKIADPDRLGVYGSSYGATLTAWTIAQSNQFKGAVGAVGMYDLLQDARLLNQSFHSISDNRSKGTTQSDFWFNPEVYQKISPMEHYQKINTPMLLIETSGERELNRNQATPLFHALLTKKVETNLIYYPHAFHNGGWNDEYKRDYMKRLVAWFDYCIKGIALPSWFHLNE